MRRSDGGLRPETKATIVAGILLLLPIWAARDLILVGTPEAGVTLKALPADLVYGAQPPKPGAPGFELPVPTIPSDTFDDVFTPPPNVAAGRCEPAGPNVFPAEPAGFDVTGRVAAGRYLWQQEGTIELATLPFPAPAFASRLIRDVQPTATGYTYEVETSSLLGRRVETILVEPGVGISLSAVRIFATDGNTRAFDPLLPVQLLPLPVTIGGTVNGVGIDPVTLRTMAVQGVVKGRLRVDACGEIVDAWLVEATREFRDLENPTAAPGTYHYAIAPQLGGLFVYDHIVENGTTATSPPLPYSLEVTARIGQLEPTEVEEG